MSLDVTFQACIRLIFRHFELKLNVKNSNVQGLCPSGSFTAMLYNIYNETSWDESTKTAKLIKTIKTSKTHKTMKPFRDKSLRF